MKSKNIKFIALIIVGIVIGWREWTANISSNTEVVNLPMGWETGDGVEIGFIKVFFLIVSVVSMIAIWHSATPKMSSPNSV